MIERLVLFGATGDLAGRYLLPALAALHAAGRLPERFEIIGGLAREPGRRSVPADGPGALGGARRRRVGRRPGGGRALASLPARGRHRLRERCLPRRARPRRDRGLSGAAACALPAGGEGACKLRARDGQPGCPREAFRRRPRRRGRTQPATGRGAGTRGRAGRVPRRPRPRHGNRAEPPRNAARQLGSGGSVGQRPRRAGRDPLGGDARARGSGRLLRPGRRAEGRRPEPHAPGPVPDRDGAPGRSRGGSAPTESSRPCARFGRSRLRT